MYLLIFDWGDTVMVDYDKDGPMYIWDKVDYIPGVEKALADLSKKYQCCIATNGDYSGRDELISALKRVNAEKYFSNFFSSKEIGCKKLIKDFFRQY